MEKRLFLAFTITLVFLLFWSKITTRYFPQQPVDKGVVAEDLAIKKQPKINPLSFGALSSIDVNIEDKENQDILEAVIGNFIVKYSLTGGYIDSLALDENTQLPFQYIGLIPGQEDKLFNAQVTRNKLIFKGPTGEKKEFIFDGPLIKIVNISPQPEAILLFSNYLHSNMLDQRSQEIFYSYDKVLQRKAHRKVRKDILNNVEYVGARDRYTCFSLLKGEYDLRLEQKDKKVEIYLTSPPPEIFIYVGPQIENQLKAYDLQEIINYGFFHFIGVIMAKMLYFFYSFTKSWGVSIILLALAIYSVSFPFTAKSTKAMKKIQQIQPEIEEIKAKYKDNPKKLQKETMELYRKYKVNPLGGCLPLLFQMPIFLTLYQVLPRFAELRNAQFLWIKDLSLPDHFLKLPFSAPFEYVNLLPVLLMILGLVQQKTTTSSAAPEQKKMGIFFGVFIGIILYNFPSCLVLYWLVQNFLTFAYQLRIAKTKVV